MDRALVQDYLEKSEMNEAQAEALSRIFGEMATKSDLASLKADLTFRMLAGIVAMATIVSLLVALIA